MRGALRKRARSGFQKQVVDSGREREETRGNGEEGGEAYQA